MEKKQVEKKSQNECEKCGHLNDIESFSCETCFSVLIHQGVSVPNNESSDDQDEDSFYSLSDVSDDRILIEDSEPKSM